VNKESYINMTMLNLSRFVCFAAAVSICGCKGSEAPKTPLGAAAIVSSGAPESPIPGLTGEAKMALDSGNVFFRAKAYDMALAEYIRSADLAPTEVAPLLGIMMVADVTKNSKLAEATLPRIRKLDPSMADSSTVSSHSKMMKAHPRAGAPPST